MTVHWKVHFISELSCPGLLNASLHITALIQDIHNFAVADKNPQQHVPVQEYSENLKEIARFLASVGVSADRVIFISPPPVHEPAWEKECILKGSF